MMIFLRDFLLSCECFFLYLVLITARIMFILQNSKRYFSIVGFRTFEEGSMFQK